MPAKRSSTSGALSWILAVVLVSVAAIGVGWLLGQQVLNWLNPGRSSVSDSGSADTSYSYYPWDSPSATSASDSTVAEAPTVTLPTSTVSSTPATTTASTASSTPVVPSQTTTTPAATAPKLWKVRVGSFATREQATVASQELAAQGLPIFVTGSGPFAVQVGAFAKRENAIALGDSLADQGYDVLVTD
jgi:cell division septation protein DedD